MRTSILRITALISLIKCCFGSIGDRSPYFRHCLDECIRDNCLNKEGLQRFNSEQSLINRLTRWGCRDECKYVCMWMTVDQFEQRGEDVPQFYGKWPFLRWGGMQEPASAIFSLFNLASSIYMFYSCQKCMPNDTPLRMLWTTYSVVVSFAWFWSLIFHTRDFPWTEKMDYFCAFASVMYGFYASLVRMHGLEPVWRIGLIGLILFSYYVYHVYYLGFVKFDYGYNMKANVTIGLANSLSWTLWCTYQYLRNGRTYVWRCVVVIISALSLLSLELYDFSPIWWTFDAHSLWHLGTAPLPVLWTRFALDDCELLRNEKKLALLRKTI